ncbi:MAG: hypothetical protein ACJ72Q_09795 [Nitrososphaeraceae archaeon]|jgi:hypothetical protein
MAAAATTTKTSTTDNQQDRIVDKSKEETIKTELPISQSYMTTKQNNESNKMIFLLGLLKVAKYLLDNTTQY